MSNHTETIKMSVHELAAFYNGTTAITDINLEFPQNRITAIIGPSGCGKSTLLRCLNRMHEEVYGARVKGEVLLNGENIYATEIYPPQIRRRVGMVFQKANPFPMMSVYDNVAAGLKLSPHRPANLDEIVQTSLERASLWGEVKDKLHKSGAALSGGQQQRLCIARTIAIQPEVILLDEPCSQLDPKSTGKIEELMLELKSDYTLVLVTHNMQEAARVSDFTAFLLADDRHVGHLVEFGATDVIFTAPRDARTHGYITGQFG